MCNNDSHKHTVVAITGGIGAGKSVVSKILMTKGFRVYDCDSKAKRLMDSSQEIRSEIAAKISSEALNLDGTLCRKKIADIVFSDSNALSTLNSIVHKAVREDFTLWTQQIPGNDPVFVETAILYQSRMHALVDCIWEVIAPEEIRVERVMKRSNLTANEVAARIKSQTIQPPADCPPTLIINNDGFTAVLPQVNQLLKNL